MSSSRVLILTPDNPCNCTLVDQVTETICYTVSTEQHPHYTITQLKGENDEILASWKRQDSASDDILTLGSSKPIAASTWLRKSSLPFKTQVNQPLYLQRVGGADVWLYSSVAFTGGTNNAKYRWKNNDALYELKLHSEDDMTHPIARFKQSAVWEDRTHDPPISMSRSATLILYPRGQEIQDLVVISFLILERNKRAKGKGKGSVKAGPLSASGMALGV
ncbi:hypothetical protein BKA70DRAFT_1104622 [Coprinopsis sp. MPI-PUGE-AT-0042]|nr:hypothetical protein BKA70DRAFT_1104622 [Coprinopsis sp. MPI-PUGE-AT-0042]